MVAGAEQPVLLIMRREEQGELYLELYFEKASDLVHISSQLTGTAVVEEKREVMSVGCV